MPPPPNPPPPPPPKKRIKRINTENVQKNYTILFSVIFVAFFVHNFLEGVIIVSKMLERSPINVSYTCISDFGKTGS